MPAGAVSPWYVSERPDPEPNTFEIGLVLAGAVSAGAYTAGVLDFLFEALDTWYRSKREDEKAGRVGDERTVPHHTVRVQIITGASAGGMNGAIAAVALRDAYPRSWSDEKLAAVAAAGGPAPGRDVDRTLSPFYSPWVRQIDIRQLLGTSDLEKTIYSPFGQRPIEIIGLLPHPQLRRRQRPARIGVLGGATGLGTRGKKYGRCHHRGQCS